MLSELIKQQYAQMRGLDDVVNDTSKPVVWVTKETLKAPNRAISYQSKYVTEYELMGLKRCPKCRRIKKLDCFAKNSTTKDGKAHYCRECNKEYYHEYHELRKRKGLK